MHQDLIIHSEVRDWVFIPLTLLIIMMNMLRQYAHLYMNSSGANYEQPANDVKEPQVVRRSARVRMMSSMLPYDSYARRKAYFVGKTAGVLVQEMPAVNMQAKMMSDPSMMTNMLKSQLTGTAPHLLMGFLVNHFFSGFIMGKIPFTLTPRFKQMMQRGIDMPGLDVSYFTSLSYYILLLFGLRGILQLIFSGDVIDESAMMNQSMKGANPAFDAKQEYKSEAQRYDLVDHKWALKDSEAKAIKALQRHVKSKTPAVSAAEKKNA